MKKVVLPLSEYPRPQLVRDSYLSLNGKWSFSISKDENIPESFENSIIVPYSPDVEASGINKTIGPDDYIFYKKEFKLNSSFENEKIILHFGGVDQIADIFINGKLALTHVGGLIPFELDIKDYLKKTKNTLIVRVKDYSDTKSYTVGKQSLKKGEGKIPAQAGIYMPVWLEAVSYDYVESIKVTPDIDKKLFKISVKSIDPNIKLKFLGTTFNIKPNRTYEFKMSSFELWTPENPKLYEFEVFTTNDHVKSYFAMRKFSIVEDKDGIKRLALNNEPLFVKGIIDSGYYDKGGLTPLSDEDYVNDIKYAKEMGFNVIRKHLKVESLRYYYHCDKLGMIVFQDFPNGGEYSSKKPFDLFNSKQKAEDNKYSLFGRLNEEAKAQSIQEFKEIINILYNSPSVGLYTIFNEGMGQFDSKSIYEQLIKLDNTRLYDHASGYSDQGISDIKSIHDFDKKLKLPSKKEINNRALLLSECGKIAYSLENDKSKDIYGATIVKDKSLLLKEYQYLINNIVIPNIEHGLSGFIYNQLRDCDNNKTGLLSKDGKTPKLDLSEIKILNNSIKF